MSRPVISVESVSKLYRLGEISTGTLSHDLNRWWHKVRGKEDPYAQVGQTNDRSKKDAGTGDYVWALQDISFQVEEGDVVGIIGKNGAGKSTLLKILSRVTAPTRGSIRIRGRMASLLEVGTGFHPELTGRENIYLNGAILGMRRHEVSAKLNEIIDFSGCAAYVDTPVKRYSSGMYVRLAFAVAAHLEPEILVIDEVLAVGDAEFQKRCLAKMDEVSHKHGRTILFVSHQLGVISALCKKGILVQNGQLGAVGPIQDVMEKYLARQEDTTGETRWSAEAAPTGQHVRMEAVRVISKDVMTSTVNLSSPLQLELDYEVIRAGPVISISFHLLDGMGSCIFATANLASCCLRADPIGSKRLETGRYRSTCALPAYFLNDAVYRVSAFAVCDNSHVDAEAKECISFKGHDDGNMRHEYTGTWVGQLRPRLDWQTMHLD